MACLVALALMFAAPVSPNVDKARQAAGWFFAGKYSELIATFTPEMKAKLSGDQLKQVAGQLHSLGTLQQMLDPEVSHAQEFEIVVIPLQFEHAALDFQFTFNSAGQIAGMFLRPRADTRVPWQPPPYSQPSRFRAEEVTVGRGEWSLPGTLALPVGKGPFPAVVLVHGSGPNDRDESIGPSKPFRDLAEGLASRGIAVLRYEKRTRQYPAQCVALKTFTIREETIDDALAAAALLRARPEIDPAAVFVLGHSLGGYAAPRIGAADPKLAGLIIMAGNTRPIEDLIIEQTTYLVSLGPESPEAQRNIEALQKAVARVKSLKKDDASADEQILGAPASYWLDLRDYKPAALARTLKMPMLILQGARDYQVTAADFEGWREALKGLPTVTMRSYPALNHLFMAGDGKSTPSEYTKPGQHIASQVIDDIAAWIAAVAEPRASASGLRSLPTPVAPSL